MKKFTLFTLLIIVATNFNSYSYSESDTKPVVISKGKVTLTLKDNKKKLIEDKLQCPCYTFKRYLEDVGYFVFSVVGEGSEGMYAMIVNDKNGEEFKLDAIPLVSPDKKKLVTASMDLSAGFDPNQIEIWHFTTNGIQKDYSLTLDKWGPSDPIWVDDNTISLYKNVLNPDTGTISNKRPKIFLKFDGKDWSLSDEG